MISSNDFRTGTTIELDGAVWRVIEFLHVKPGKGSAFVRTKLKAVQTGNVVEKTFRAGETVPQALLEKSTPEMKWVIVTRPVILQRTTSRRRSSPPSTKDVFPAKQETANDDVTFPQEKGVMDDKGTKAEQEECKNGSNGGGGGTYTKKEGKNYTKLPNDTMIPNVHNFWQHFVVQAFTRPFI